MFISSLILAISSSIDSLGIGITYGIKNIKITFFSKIILFSVSIIISFLSIFSGYFLNDFLPIYFTSFLGGIILIIIGFTFILKSFLEKNKKENNYYDFNHSNSITAKEAIVLGLALSLDSFAIGVSYSLTNSNCFLFPILISIFQIFFLSTGSLFGKKIRNLSNIPNFLNSVISGVILILIGIYRL